MKKITQGIISHLTLTFTIALAILLIAGSTFIIAEFINSSTEEVKQNENFEAAKYSAELHSQPIIEHVRVEVGSAVEIDLSKYELDGLFFEEIVNATLINNKLSVKGSKDSVGNEIIKVPLANSEADLVIEIETYLSSVEWEELKQEIQSYLGDSLNSYGIMVYDLKRGQTLEINPDKIFPPASSAKLTIAALVLRDIEQGKYSLDSTFPVNDRFKHSEFDSIGALPDGTEVKIRTYLEELIILSSNTAWYHLVHMLGDSYEAVNPRTINELGVNPLFLDPYMSTARNFVIVMKDIYFARTLSPESRDYLFDLMRNATEFNRGGIGLGLPDGVDFVNKLGYHWTDDLINFNDVAIVFGEKTDYAIAIIDENIDWVTGKENLKNISKMVYRYLN
ncbi:MAG: hypothetical protein Kow0081_1850 [Candidatus Dojkabacteria bacterium]